MHSISNISNFLKKLLSIKNKQFNHYLFLPLLIFYIIILILFNRNEIVGDESRYLNFSENINNGFYAEKDLKPGFLWNGPGYPLILSPFTHFKINLLVPKILNCIFLFSGVIFLYKSLRFNLSQRTSFLISYFAGLSHPYFIKSISVLMTEALSFMLISISLFYALKTISDKKYILIYSFFSGYLILTKVFFAYVFLLCGIIFFLYWLTSNNKKKSSFLFKICFFPFLICIPYLIYTYNITNKFFYWSDAGGSSLYSMSTPFENEYGDWFPSYEETAGFQSESMTTKYKVNSISKNHAPFLSSLNGLNGIEKNQKLLEQSIENIKANKIKYLKNIIFNFSRTAFRFPYSYFETKPIFIIASIFHFSIIFLPLMLSISKIILKPFHPDFLILIFFTVCFGGILLLSADPRFIFPIYPLLIYITSIFFRNFKQTKNSINEKIFIHNYTNI